MKYIKIETVDMFNVDWPQTPQKFFCYKRHGANSDVFLRDDFPTKRGAPWGPNEVFVYLFFIAFTVFAVPRLPELRNRWGGFPFFREGELSSRITTSDVLTCFLKDITGCHKKGDILQLHFLDEI